MRNYHQRRQVTCPVRLFVSISIYDRDLNLDSYLINTIFNHAGILSSRGPPYINIYVVQEEVEIMKSHFKNFGTFS